MSRPFTLTLTAIFFASAGFTLWARKCAIPAPDNAALDRPAKPLVARGTDRVAIFAGGCFWGTEEVFRNILGVRATQAGYTGGTAPNPTYHFIHGKNSTGYVEAVEIVYDPARVTYETLLRLFFAHHDPTRPRPGSRNAGGGAYQSLVFATDAAQVRDASRVINTLNRSGRYALPVATRVRPATRFYPAEEHHQSYYAKRGGVVSCND